jgi:hypothetical protein
MGQVAVVKMAGVQVCQHDDCDVRVRVVADKPGEAGDASAVEYLLVPLER